MDFVVLEFLDAAWVEQHGAIVGVERVAALLLPLDHAEEKIAARFARQTDGALREGQLFERERRGDLGPDD